MDIDESPAAGGSSSIDEGLYSRQLYVMGREGQARMATSNVLIVGLNGLGVEIAKNVILAGVKSVTLHDTAPTTWLDLSAQFYLSEKDLGQPRAASCCAQLAELNPYVRVSCRQDALDEAFLQQFQCVVMVNQPLKKQLLVNDICHAAGKQFVATEVAGVFGYTFSDFGDNFVVSDPNGENPFSGIVESVTQSNPALVTMLEGNRHGLETGDVVTFADMQGMDELNGRQFTITVKDPYAFELQDCDATSLGPYTTGGYCNQVKVPATVSFKPLREALTSPGDFLMSDFAKMDRPGILHQGFRGLHAWKATNGDTPPIPGDAQAAAAVLEAAKAADAAAGEGEFRLEAGTLDGEGPSKIVQALASTAAGVINPMCAFMGGVAGQEVLKACSGKFMPIEQWFYFDAYETLPDEMPSPAQVTPVGCRYDSQIVVFGKDLQQKLEKLRYFLVGAGAIGCEMIKNWALIGLGTGEGGAVHCTDMDTIEKSNLSRQFLFRSADIGSLKSECAVAKAKAMNPDMNVVHYESRVGPDTEGFFGDTFFENLDGVTNALDNLEARLYMDQRCVFFQLPLLESGTLGTKGNTQMVVPHLTENYGATRDPPEKSIPVCTLKNFPNQIEHTLQWARDYFEGVFKQHPEDANNYLTNPGFMAALQQQQNTKLETLRKVKESLLDSRPNTFEDCIAFARLRFQDSFHNSIMQLLHNFPADTVTAAGTLFWSGSKRPPTPVVFDAADPLHMQYIKAAANLRATNYGIAGSWDDDAFLAVLPSVVVPPFKPKDGVKIAVTEKEAAEEKEKAGGGGGAAAATSDPDLMDVDTQCAGIIAQLPPPQRMAGVVQIKPVDFDKDVDEHMLFVTACSNLRARNYKIPEADMHRSRLIAGKIIPAIATTTALVTGLVCLELYKIVQAKPVEALKNGYVNLAVPVFAFSEPQVPASEVAKILKDGDLVDWKWTCWDKLDIQGDLTLKDTITYMEDNFGLEVNMLSSGVSILYSLFQNKKKQRERMGLPMSKVVELVTGRVIAPGQKYQLFDVMCTDEEGEDVDLPPVRMILG